MLSTVHMHSNLVSYSDGVNSTGRLLFYLTDLDATAQDLEVLQCDADVMLHIKGMQEWDLGKLCSLLVQVDARATLTVGEIQVKGSCGVMDPEVSRLFALYVWYPCCRL